MVIKKLYNFYNGRIFPHISHIRGATRIKIILKSRLLNQLEKYKGEPQSIFERGEWDNLIILDACRYDQYNEMKDYEAESRITLGSTSHQYLERTFVEGEYDDIVYISANGFFTDTMLKKHLGKTDLFHDKFDTIETDWDQEKGTVLPEKVVRDAKTAGKLYPDKKKIIHFIQPHYPFLDRDFGERSDTYLPDGGSEDALEMAEKGKISREEIIHAYKENLKIVLEHAEELAGNLNGRTVVTADHGELLGENGLYGHPGGSNAEKLRKVPWDLL